MNNRESDHVYMVAIVVLIAIVFTLDLLTPLGWSSGSCM